MFLMASTAKFGSIFGGSEGFNCHKQAAPIGEQKTHTRKTGTTKLKKL